ncbi:hypothetical protein LSH36_178g06126, partial [Paralvinella palmiformis]
PLSNNPSGEQSTNSDFLRPQSATTEALLVFRNKMASHSSVTSVYRPGWSDTANTWSIGPAAARQSTTHTHTDRHTCPVRCLMLSLIVET